MPDLTQCPECQRKLNVPDGQLGQDVRCPACGNQFTAARFIPPRPEAVARELSDPEPPQPQPRRPRDYPEPDSNRGEFDDLDDDRPRRPRSPYERGYGRGFERPHRGSTVQVLGILCICLCWTTWPCWILGGIAIAMASTDLTAMAAGNMDRSGQNATQAGRTCAIIGLCLDLFLIFTCCGGNLMMHSIR